MSETFTNEKTRIATKKKTETKKPSMWHVIILNDDFTPMDFVVDLLMRVFGKSHSEADTLAFQIHVEGRAIAGTYTFEVAETKQLDTMALARAEKYPLLVVIEPVPQG